MRLYRRIHRHISTPFPKSIIVFLIVIFSIGIFGNTPLKKTATKRAPLTFQKQFIGQYAYTGTVPGVLKASFGKNTLEGTVSVERENTKLTFSLPIAHSSIESSGQFLTPEGVQYASPKKNIEVKYSLIDLGLKEEIILNKIPAENTFPSTLKTEGLITKISSEGIPVFFDKNNTYQFHFERPFVKDGKGAVSYDVKYSIVGQKEVKDPHQSQFSAKLLSGLQNINQTDKSYVLQVEVDPKWLHNPKRVLPIIIDPTVLHNTVSIFATGSSNRVNDTPAPLATGGIITNVGGYTIHTFTGSGTFTPTVSMNVDYLVVGGGGGGGVCYGGGGGGGGVLYNTSYSVTENTPITVTIGTGGTNQVNVNGNGGPGGSSSFGPFTATGGGYGGGNCGNIGGNGASGGGGSSTGTSYALGGTGIAGPGSDGNTSIAAGGGGGGAAGGDASTVTRQGKNGLSYDISGYDTYYGGGGSGGGTPLLAGGTGGGGSGGTALAAGVADATPNTGGGGGGTIISGTGVSGIGGSGVVIVRYLNNISPSLESFYQPLPADEYTVGLWHMDEVSGNAFDSSGNGNTGVPTGGFVATGLIGGGRSMNTVGGASAQTDYIDTGITNTSSLKFTTGFTVEAWIYPTAYDASHNTVAGEETGFLFAFNSVGAVADYIYAGGAWTSATGGSCTIPLNTWSHKAMTYDGVTVNSYLNGVLCGSTLKTGSMLSANNIYIGMRNPGGTKQPFHGTIDEVRISNTARTPEQIKAAASRRPSAIYTSPVSDFTAGLVSWSSFTWTEGGVNTGDGEILKNNTNLIAQWNLNDTSGTTATNNAGSCGASCNGTLTNFMATASQDQAFPLATGGTVTSSGGYTTHTFTTMGEFTPNVAMNVEALVVGGGGGGANTGGGGGAGGYVYNSSVAVTASPYMITVGTGGPGGQTAGAGGTSGNSSIAIGITAAGGGGGSSHGGAGGGNGGSGGGGAVKPAAPASTGGTGSQGYNGGVGRVDAGWVGNNSGGGGAGAAGGVGSTTNGSGAGGIGLANSISGTSVYYAGGGGGGPVNGTQTAGLGGNGGGGNGTTNGVGGAGSPNTGGGGGGGSYSAGVYYNGGAGGSGVVIIRYPSAPTGWTANNRRWGGGALMFDGIDDYVSIPHNATLNVGGGPFTIETWVKPNNLNARYAIFSTRRTNAAGSWQLEVGIGNGGTGRVSITGVGTWIFDSVNNVISPGVWNHIAYTRASNSDTGTLYINGRAIPSLTTTAYTIIDNSDVKLVGAGSSLSGYFPGVIDSTRLYGRVLSANEVLSNYASSNIEFQTRVGNTADPNDGTWEEWRPVTPETTIDNLDGPYQYNTSDTGLISYWPMDETTGTTVIDQKNGNGGTSTGAIVSGKFGNGIALNGSSTFISVPHNSNMSPTSAVTVEGWFKPSATFSTSSDNNQGIIDQGGYQFYLDKTDGKAHWVVNDNTAKAFSALGTGANGRVTALTVWNGNLYAGGQFTLAGGVANTVHIAKWDGTTWSALGTGANGDVWSLEVWNGNLYVGGDFTLAGGVANTVRIAKWDGTTWSALGTGASSTVAALSVWNGNLYAGGTFTTIGGVSANSIARWNGATWSALGTGANGLVESISVLNGNLYAGGWFTQAGGVANTAYIARWNGTTWSALGTGANNFVTTLTIWDGSLYAGGLFTQMGGVANTAYIARWNGTSWNALGTGANGGVWALTVWDGKLVAGGTFTSIGGTSANYLASWNGATWSALGAGTNVDDMSLGVWNGNLYLGGDFTLAGGIANTVSIAKWGTSNTVSLTSTTTSWTGGMWNHFAGVSDGSNLKLYINGVLQSSVASPITLGAQSQALLIGKTYGSQWAGGSDEQFAGSIDEIRLYGAAQTAATVYQHYIEGSTNANAILPSTDTIAKIEGTGSEKIQTGIAQTDINTAALWHLDETNGTGAYLKDSSGNGNHGTPTGVNNTVINGVAGKARFIGNSSDITVTDSTSLKPTRITIEHWIKTGITTDNGYIYKYHGVSPFEGYGMNVFGASYAGRPGCWVGGTAWTVGTVPINDNKWHHVACVYDGTNVTIYTDGMAGTSLAQTASLSYTIDLHIGNSSAVNLDEVKISNVARSSEEIAEDYRMGRDHYVNKTISTTDLSNKTTLPFYVAADKPGTYLSTTVGNSAFANYQPDANTVGLWHMDENNQEISDAFTGTTIISSKWAETDASNKIAQNNGLVLSAGAAAAWDSAIVSQSTFPRAQGQTIYAKFTTGASVASPNHMMIGWATNSTSTPSYTNINHALYFNAGGFNIYQDGANIGAVGSGYVANTTYEVKITLTTANTATYSVKGGVYTNWTTLYAADTSKVNTPLRVQVAQYQMTGTFSEISVIPADKITDGSGMNNHGVSGGATPIQGKIDIGKDFNGASDFIQIPDADSLSFGNGTTDTPMTISAWVNPHTLGGTGSGNWIINKRGTGALDEWQLVFWQGQLGLALFTNNTNSMNQMTNTTWTAGQWYHVVTTYDGSKTNAGIKIYVNGILQTSTGSVTGSYTGMNNTIQPVTIGRPGWSPALYFDGTIDEVRIDNVVRSASDVRQAYEVGLRSHPITIEFAATLDRSGHVPDSYHITNASDLSFRVDATYFGLQQKGDGLYVGDKIIVRENYNGTEYIAQGTVNSVTPSTGAVTVSAWDSGSTFPSAGFDTDATVFKWQREYWNITEPLDNQINALTNLTLRLTDGSEGRTVWLDDIKSAGDYLTTPTGSSITSSTGNRYFQYRAIFSSSDEAVSSNLSTVTVNYVGNTPPNTPTLTSPSDTVVNQSLLPTLVTTTTDPNGDYLRYRIELCTNVSMTSNCQTYAQTTSQTGWSGQDVQTYTAYASGSTATYTLQTPLNTNTTYYWRSYAIDQGGIITWSDTQSSPYRFTTTNSPTAPTALYTEGTVNPTAVAHTNPTFSAVYGDIDSDLGTKYQIQVNTASNFSGTTMWDSGTTTLGVLSSGNRMSDVTYAGTALTFNGSTYYWRIRFTDINEAVGQWSSAAQFTMNVPPLAPVLNSPANSAVSVILLPTLRTTGTDPNGDHLRYKIEICTDVLMTPVNCQTFDQTTSQTGWSGQNALGNTAYNSGSTAAYTLQTALNAATVYYWRSYVFDVNGSNSWGATQSPPFSFTTTVAPRAATNCVLNESMNDSSYTIRWTDASTDENGYEIKRSVDNGAYTTLITGLAANTTSHQDNTISAGHTYSYQIAPYYTVGPAYGQWCTTTKLTIPQNSNPYANTFSFD
jgi:hypothetical protein